MPLYSSVFHWFSKKPSSMYTSWFKGLFWVPATCCTSTEVTRPSSFAFMNARPTVVVGSSTEGGASVGELGLVFTSRKPFLHPPATMRIKQNAAIDNFNFIINNFKIQHVG